MKCVVNGKRSAAIGAGSGYNGAITVQGSKPWPLVDPGGGTDIIAAPDLEAGTMRTNPVTLWAVERRP
jgi:hypothetical protein